MNPITLVFLVLMVFSSIRHGRFDSPAEWLYNELLLVPGIIVGLSFHEFAHAFVSNKLGDPTPAQQGRVTINPGAHIDPIGLITLLFIGFGWGKPVEIDPRYYRNRKGGEILVSLAGVIMNLIIALITSLVLKALWSAGFVPVAGISEVIWKLLFSMVQINLVLMVFNLLPVPPLDGFSLITAIFDLKKYNWWYKLYNSGMIILLVLILFNITDLLLSSAVGSLSNAMLSFITGQ